MWAVLRAVVGFVADVLMLGMLFFRSRPQFERRIWSFADSLRSISGEASSLDELVSGYA
jgi:hypothetical protein